MVSSNRQGMVRMSRLGIITTTALVVTAWISSCSFDTKTILCTSADESGSSVLLRCPSGSSCTKDQTACIQDNCGNGRSDNGEVCDDGNVRNGDGCSDDCKSNETCGNGVIDEDGEMEEECDDGDTINGDGCSALCQKEVCGNLIVERELGEVCDDGNKMSFDGCRNDCLSIEACGNNVLDPHLGEDCEFSDHPYPYPPSDRQDCDKDCTSAMCGDGYHNALHRVMDAGPEHFEECDSGVMGMRMDSPDCDQDCTFAICGDGYRNASMYMGNSVEECDEGAGNSNVTPNGCRTDCRRFYCGDHVIDSDNDETCEDHNHKNDDSCPDGDRGTCRVAICGDDHVKVDPDNPNWPATEECDDGTMDLDQDGKVNSDTAPDACRKDCRKAFCGDGVKDPGRGEVCDKGGNAKPEVGCESDQFCNMNCTACADLFVEVMSDALVP